jgi:predicted component of type VI protein secretion system
MLTIQVISYKDVPLESPISAEFGEIGGTIGRSPESTLLLPDPDRIISRIHAVIAHREGRFVIRDQGTTVALLVNGQAPGRGQDHPLAQGDVLKIASYAMQVTALHAKMQDKPVSEDETTTILREGTLLSWSEDGQPTPKSRISTVIVPSSDHEEPATASPTPVAPAATAAPVARASTPASESADALLTALLRGAGVKDLPVTGGLTPELMEEIGAVMRETLRGLLDLLAARAHAKREVRADATIIVASDNNPLKFAPGLDAAITHLLVPRGQGFMSPQRSIADARQSLRSHQEGFVAGMRAALAAVLARFDPAKLEQRLTESDASGSLLPMNHKAKLWNLYEALYGEISREAETDFHFLFGEEFLRAYQAKTGTLPKDDRKQDVP